MKALGNFPYLASFVAGLFTFASPCVLPLIPVYISFITGVSVTELEEKTRSELLKTFMSAVFFVLGFCFIFVMLGASASYLGNLVGTHRGFIKWIGGIVVIIFGIHLTGLFRLKILYREKRFDINISRIAKTDFSSFFVGMAFAVGWTPCVGPILSSILILASAQGTVYKGMLLLFLYSLGLGIPFLVTAVFINQALRMFSRIKKYFGFIEIASGAVLVLVGALILSDNFKVFSALIGRLIE